MASQLNMWNLRKTTTDAHKTVNLQKWDNNDKMATTLAKVQLHEKKCNYVGKNSTPSSKMQIHCPQMQIHCPKRQIHGQDALGQAITRMGHLGRCTVNEVRVNIFWCRWLIMSHRHQKIFILMIVPPGHLRSLDALLSALRVKMGKTGTTHYCKMWRWLNLE